jgi:hypothetical protein
MSCPTCKRLQDAINNAVQLLRDGAPGLAREELEVFYEPERKQCPDCETLVPDGLDHACLDGKRKGPL